MAPSIPNDIYQYSFITAVRRGLTDGGPVPPMLTNHGTHGIGIFGNTDNSMVLIDSVAYCITSDGKAKVAPRNATLPFTMVTVFEPTFRSIPGASLRKDDLRDYFAGDSKTASGKNTPMPFRIGGTFDKVEVGMEGKAGQTLKDVQGTIFGFAIPSWAENISGEGIQCYFVSAEVQSGTGRGGFVRDFEASQVMVEWAKCGRFHLGFPQSEEWESLQL